MTNLHYLLIGLAVVLVGGVMLYNHLQERRLRKQIDGMFRRGLEETGDVPLASEAVESIPVEPVPGAVETQELGRLPAAVEDNPETYDDMLNLMRRASLDQDEDNSAPPLASLAAEDDARADAPTPAAAPMERVEAIPEVVEPGSAAVNPWDSGPRPVTPPVSVPVTPVRAPEAQPENVPSVSRAEPVESKAHVVATPSPLDAEIECIARLRASHPEAVSYAALIDRLRRVGKATRAFGFHEARGWEAIGALKAGTYDLVEIGLQMVDRKGGLSRAQLDDYCEALYEFAAEHGGAVTCPELVTVLEKSRELDNFCMAVDMLIGVNIVAPEGIPFMGRRIDDLARDAGMVLNKHGAYILPDAEGHALFSLANQQNARFVPEDKTLTTPAITLLFDVPNVADGLAVFDRMTALGFDMARALGGRMMDDQGHAVTQASLSNDRRQLAGFYERMRTQGIPAGGERARRLFA